MLRNKKEFICKCCNKPFLSLKKNPTYCSKECQYRGMSKEIIIIKCQQCGEEFKTKDVKRKFCSLDCSNKSIGVNKLNNPKPMNTKCDCCGKEFYLPKCRLPKYEERRYCSAKCKGDYKVILSMQKCQLENNIDDMKEWLFLNYIIKKRTYREMSKDLSIHGSRLLSQWLTIFNIPIKHGSEAIIQQWIGEKGVRRKQISSEIAYKYLCSEDARNNLRDIMQTKEYRNKCRVVKLGKLNPAYNSNLTDEYRKMMYIDKRDDGYSYWRRKVYEKDHFTCQITNIKGSGNLVAHHMNGYNLDIENRFNVENGVTILNDIHKLFHHHYGYGNNTKEQFEEFKIRYQLGEFNEYIKSNQLPTAI